MLLAAIKSINSILEKISIAKKEKRIYKICQQTSQKTLNNHSKSDNLSGS